MSRYLPVFESLGFFWKLSQSDLHKSLTPVSKPFVFVTLILFKSLAKPGYGNSIQFVNFSFFEFSSGEKVAKFCFKIFLSCRKRGGRGASSSQVSTRYPFNSSPWHQQEFQRSFCCGLEYAFHCFLITSKYW